jgi:hypothetical protein
MSIGVVLAVEPQAHRGSHNQRAASVRFMAGEAITRTGRACARRGELGSPHCVKSTLEIAREFDWSCSATSDARAIAPREL